jgi:hypothetical protein
MFYEPVRGATMKCHASTPLSMTMETPLSMTMKALNSTTENKFTGHPERSRRVIVKCFDSAQHDHGNCEQHDHGSSEQHDRKQIHRSP